MPDLVVDANGGVVNTDDTGRRLGSEHLQRKLMRLRDCRRLRALKSKHLGNDRNTYQIASPLPLDMKGAIEKNETKRRMT